MTNRTNPQAKHQGAKLSITFQERYIHGTVEPPEAVAGRLHAAVEHMRSCELAGTPGADAEVVLDALHSYDAFTRAASGPDRHTPDCEECGRPLAADRSPGVWAHDPASLGDAAYDLDEDHAARPPEGTPHPAE